MSETTTTKVAVFFDYENIVYSLRNRFEQKANFEALMTKCAEFGQIVEARAFADWGLPYMSPALMYALQASGFDLIYVPTGSTQANSPRKNVADLYMAIQVMEVLHARPEVSHFVLMTGDRDFMPLVNHLKRSGKHVIAIGVDGSSSYYLTQSVDDFFYYSEVEAIAQGKPKGHRGRLTNAYDALVQAIRVTRERGKSPRMTNLKPVMIDLMGGFDEKELQDSHGRNFQRFKDFVQEAQRRGLVRIIRRGNAHEVYLGDQKDVSDSPTAPPDGDPIGLQVAYKLLVQAVKEADEQGKSFRSSAIRNRIRRLHKDFNEQLVYNGGGKPFETFTEFAQSAATEGLVEVRGEGTSTEILPVGEPEPEKREIDGTEAREAILAGLRAYSNYPTSFLSLASFVHRHNEQNGLTVAEQTARDMMTEAVELGLIKQIVLENGRRKYELNDDAKLSQAFLQAKKVQTDAKQADDKGSDATEKSAEATDTAADESKPDVTAYEALVTAVEMVQSEGKDPILPRIKAAIMKQLPDFDEGTLTDSAGNAFTKFKDFVLEGQERGLVTVIEHDRGQSHVVVPAKDEQAVEEAGLTEAQAADEEDSSIVDDDAITQEELTAAVAAAIDELESKPKKSKSKEKAEAKKSEPQPAVEPETLKQISEREQRELMVRGMQSFNDYPAPFMGILAHCRAIRDEQQVYLGNSDMRELLSEANSRGLLNRTTDNDVRPSLYAYAEDEALLQQYVAQEDEAEEETVEAVSAEVEQPAAEPEPQPEPEQPVPAEPPVDAAPEVSDSDLRQFVVDVLRSVPSAGAEFKAIEETLNAARDKAEVAVADTRLKNLLQVATRQGVLEVKSPYGVRPRLFGLTDEAETVNAFLGIAAAPEAPEVADQPAPDEQPAVEPEAADIFTMLATAVEQLSSEGKSTGFSSLKRRMRKLITDFNEKDHEDKNGKPFKRFKDFVLAAQARGVVQLDESNKNVELPKAAETETVEEAAAEEAPVQATEDAGGIDANVTQTVAEAAVEAEADDPLTAAYQLLNTAVADAESAGRSQRLPAIRTRMLRMDESFDIADLRKKKGGKFKSMPDFVRSAEKAGYVRLEGKGAQLTVHMPE